MYYEMVNQKSNFENMLSIRSDHHQLKALQSLERLLHDLKTIPPPPLEQSISSSQSATSNISTSSSSNSTGSKGWGNGWFSSMLSSSSSSSSSSTVPTTPSPIGGYFHSSNKDSSSSSFIPGVYLHGGVGCGKTFLMNNIFYESINGTLWDNEKQKTHFHQFMLNVHNEMHMARQRNHQNNHGHSNQHVSDTILPAVIEETAKKGRLICFDEFQVTDVADALILQRLFTGLWNYGCIVVATSNRPPTDLYKDGLQRDRFIPFIHLLENKCEVVSLWESETDYRLIQKSISSTTTTSPDGTTSTNNNDNTDSAKVYFCAEEYQGTDSISPLKQSKDEFNTLFYKLVGRTAVTPTALTTQGRKVSIPQAALSKGIARFTFEDLCQKALGAADYLIIGQTFHTVFVENIPVLSLYEINYVRRFIIFIDTMYESNVKLIIQSKSIVSKIFQPSTSSTSNSNTTSNIANVKSTTQSNTSKNDDKIIDDEYQQDEVFAFQRTVSRLEEMSSVTYLQRQHKRWCVAHYAPTTEITKPIPQQQQQQHQHHKESSTSKTKTTPAETSNVVEPKAALLSKRRAIVDVTPS
jgi:predicted ATPase